MMSSKEGNNWQIVSNGLAAYAQVYSYRVDSIHSEIFKILGGLNRNEKNGEKNEQEKEDEQEGVQINKKRLKNIETNKEKLEIKKFELDNQVDPLFKHTTAKFSQVNAKGLLNYVLDIDEDLCLVLEGNKEPDEKREQKERKKETSFLESQEFNLMKQAFQESFTNENLDLCVSLNSIKKIIVEKGALVGGGENKNSREEYSPNKISNVFLIKDDLQLLSRLDKDFSNQVLQENIEEDKQNNIYSQEAYDYAPYNFNENIEDDNIEPENPNDMSFHSIIISEDNLDNDLNSEGSKQSKGTFNRFIESSQKQIQTNPLFQFETDGNKENNIHGFSYRKSILNNKLDFTSHLQQIGRGGDFFDRLKPKGIQQRLNWENVLESGMKQKEMIEKKKEEIDRRSKVLFDFFEGSKEIVYRKEGKKMNKKRNNEDEMRKNRVMIGYRGNLCTSLFTNVNMRISTLEGEERVLNRLEEDINENDLEVKKSNEKGNEDKTLNEKDNYEIDNLNVDDDNEFNENNTEAKADPFYSNSTHKIIYTNFRNNLDEEKKRLENLYKVVNVRKIKKQIFDQIEEFQKKDNKKRNEKEKDLDFISIVNGVNEPNNENNRKEFINPATCFVSLLHLCNEKSKIIIYI